MHRKTGLVQSDTSKADEANEDLIGLLLAVGWLLWQEPGSVVGVVASKPSGKMPGCLIPKYSAGLFATSISSILVPNCNSCFDWRNATTVGSKLDCAMPRRLPHRLPHLTGLQMVSRQRK